MGVISYGTYERPLETYGQVASWAPAGRLDRCSGHAPHPGCMSYCRWSTHDHQCDVYVYEDVAGGWTTWVASRRFEFAEPLPEPVELGPDTDVVAWLARHREMTDRFGNPEHGTWVVVPEPGGEGSRHFNHDTPGECADNLEHLAGLGIVVPQFAIDALREEQAEMDQGHAPIS